LVFNKLEIIFCSAAFKVYPRVIAFSSIAFNIAIKAESEEADKISASLP
jgi:hypothetical protein